MKNLRVVAIYALICLSAACVAQQVDIVHVPLNRVQPNSVFQVIVKINDGETAKFLIDTGCNHILVSNQLNSRLKLPTKPAVSDDGTAITYNGKPANMTSVSKFQVGDSFFKQVPLVIVDAKTLRFDYGLQFDGILGANFFAGQATLFDFTKGKMILFGPGSLTAQEIAGLGMVNFDCVPMFETDDGVPAVKVTLDSSREETLIVDTGNVITSIPRKAVEQLHLKPVGDKRTQSTVFGSLTYSQTLLGKFQMGNLQYPLLPVFYQDGNKPGPTPGIGLDILARSRFLLDYPAKKIYIERPAKPGK